MKLAKTVSQDSELYQYNGYCIYLSVLKTLATAKYRVFFFFGNLKIGKKVTDCEFLITVPLGKSCVLDQGSRNKHHHKS